MTKTGYYLSQNIMNKKPQGIGRRIFARIQSHGCGWVFTPSHFEDMCSRTTVSTNLQRLREADKIRRLARGLYDYPKTHPKLGVLAPSVDALAKALTGREAIRLQPSGAYAANLLGLSTQVPMKVVYLTDGASRTVQVGQRQIILKRTTPRNMATAGRISGLVIQALRHLGKEHVDDRIIALLDRRLDQAACDQLMKDIRFAPVWVAEVFRELAKGKEGAR
ncbi:MAG: DUF6088 family protein [Verrucomicrobiota bacterium]